MRRIPPQQRREELVAAAIRVIARSGVVGATTRAVVTEADMPLGAYHYVFGSQDELMRAVIDTVTEQERFAAQVGSLDARSLPAALRSGLDAYIELLVAEPDRELALFELALFARRQDADGQMRTQWETYHRTAIELLQYAADATGSRWTSPIADVARALVAFADGITLAWLADHDTEAARRTAAFAATSLAAHAVPRDGSAPTPSTARTRPAAPTAPEEENQDAD